MELDIYYREPRLEMSVYGRLIVRIVSCVAYGIVISAAIIFSISDISWLRSLGFLLILFLLHRILKIGKSKKSLTKLPENKSINSADYFSSSSFRIIEKAYEESIFKGNNFFLRLMRLLLAKDNIQKTLVRMDVDLKAFLSSINEEINKPAVRDDKSHIMKELEYLAIEAFHYAEKNNCSEVKPKDLFAGVIKLKDKKIMRLMNAFGIEEDDLENALIFGQFFGGSRFLAGGKKGFLSIRHPFLKVFTGKHYKIRHRIMNRAWTARPTPFLDRFSKDLTDLVGYSISGFLIGHQNEYNHLVDILSRPGNTNALLVGEHSSGKTTLVEHLAFRIKTDRTTPQLFDKRLVSLSLGALVAGVKQGELQQRIEKVVSEILQAGNIILYIQDIHNLVKSGGYLKLTIADTLLPVIQNAEFPVIGSTFPIEFKSIIETNSEFKDTFEVLRLKEVTEKEAVKILIHESLMLEMEFNITISFKAVKEAVYIAHKYFRQKLLPASALDLLKEALSSATNNKKYILSSDDVVEVAERSINVPIHEIRKNEAAKLLDLEKIIHKELIDQEEAVSAVSNVIREYRSGLIRKGGPIASFLFVGPTGVGKTELSKVLTRIQFGDPSLMLRFDMSEYQGEQSFVRLIGSPDGKTRGSLTDKVLEKPYSLILLDEFEKAHPDILNLFLQVFDDGRLTDNLGRVVDFENTILIATSNAHSELIKKELEEKTPIDQISKILKRKLTDYFKAELLNRFSSIIVFKPLSRKDLLEVTTLRLKDLTDLVSENINVELSFSEESVREITKLGFSSSFGARPIRKVISDKIRAPLAEKVLKKEIERGNSITVEFTNGEFIFTKNG